MRQAKCPTCRVRYVFDRDINRRRHIGPIPCPTCGRPLQKTNHLLTWTVRDTKVVGRGSTARPIWIVRKGRTP